MNNDLISRSALLESFGEEPIVWDSRDREDVQMHNDWLDYTKLVKEATAVDAVEVVRCKDCKQHIETKAENVAYCQKFNRFMKVDDFCSYGERRNDV